MQRLAWLALILGCGGEPEPPTLLSAKPPERCTVHIAARGIYVDGDPATQAQVLARCERTTGAMVVLEDDAPKQSWLALKAELERRKIAIYLRGPVGDVDCLENPLAKGCD